MEKKEWKREFFGERNFCCFYEFGAFGEGKILVRAILDFQLPLYIWFWNYVVWLILLLINSFFKLGQTI
jgi:hypothetical protein